MSSSSQVLVFQVLPLCYETLHFLPSSGFANWCCKVYFPDCMNQTKPLLNHLPLPPRIIHVFLVWTLGAPPRSAFPRLADLDMEPGVSCMVISMSLFTCKLLASWNQGWQQGLILREDKVLSLCQGSGCREYRLSLPGLVLPWLPWFSPLEGPGSVNWQHRDLCLYNKEKTILTGIFECKDLPPKNAVHKLLSISCFSVTTTLCFARI